MKNNLEDNKLSISPVDSNFLNNLNDLSSTQLSIKMQQIAERNAYLESQAEALTIKLTEVVATNTKFISIIAHDLRSPFNSIIGILEILKDSLNDYNLEEIEKYINIVSESANRTLNLLDNLLVWTVSQNKEKNFNPVKVNLYNLVQDEFKNENFQSNQKQITLKNSIKNDLCANADMQMISTIFRNLVGNAMKFTGNGGVIVVSAIEKQQYIEITVKDNGMGIAAEEQKNLFKNHMLHSTSGTNNEHGIGLGLILCKEFVELHGGTIRVTSKPGNGSSFIFTLPHYI